MDWERNSELLKEFKMQIAFKKGEVSSGKFSGQNPKTLLLSHGWEENLSREFQSGKGSYFCFGAKLLRNDSSL